jgi:hypothetical protein
MYPQEKPAEKCEKYMTLLPANGYKEKGKRTAAKLPDGSNRHYLNSK